MYWCCPSRPCVVFLACVHLTLFLALALSPGNSLVSSWCDQSMLASLLWKASNSSLFTPALLRTHSFVFFAVNETHAIAGESNGECCVKNVQNSQKKNDFQNVRAPKFLGQCSTKQYEYFQIRSRTASVNGNFIFDASELQSFHRLSHDSSHSSRPDADFFCLLSKVTEFLQLKWPQFTVNPKMRPVTAPACTFHP